MIQMQVSIALLELAMPPMLITFAQRRLRAPEKSGASMTTR